MLLGPVCNVRNAAAPVRGVEMNIVEPCVSVNVRAAPLGFAYVYVGRDEYAFRGSEIRDVRPDLETRSLRRPTGVLCNDLVCDFGAGNVLVELGPLHDVLCGERTH